MLGGDEDGSATVRGLVGAISIAIVVAGLTLLITGHFAPQETASAALGDTDCDGSVTSIDALLILQFSARRVSSLPCQEAGDVNRDGSITSIDALFVLQFVAGLIDEFARCDATASPGSAQDAIDDAAPGTTICLRPGVYDRLFVYRKSDITIIGSGMQNTVVTDDPDEHTCLLVLESEDVQIRDVRAQTCTVQAAFAGDSTNVVFERVETTGGPIGFQFRNSSGLIARSRAHDHDDFGAIVQINSDVTIDGSTFQNSGIGILSQDGATLRVLDSRVTDNDGGGIFTVKETGHTTIDETEISGNSLNVFAGVPGCANLPPGDPNPPQCFLDDPQAFVSEIELTIADSVIRDSGGTGVVLFPGVQATLRRNIIAGNQLTGLFAWGTRLAASDNEYSENVENGIECRAYPGPSSGDRGMCDLDLEYVHDSLPLSGSSLGGGFVSEGGQFELTDSLIESNWGIGVQVLHGGKGRIVGNNIRNNGGTAFCISGETWIELSNNVTSGNREGECLGHP